MAKSAIHDGNEDEPPPSHGPTIACTLDELVVNCIHIAFIILSSMEPEVSFVGLKIAAGKIGKMHSTHNMLHACRGAQNTTTMMCRREGDRSGGLRRGLL